MSIQPEVLLRDYGVRYEEASNEFLTVRCPFHNDTNPSGRVDRVKGKFRCWSCNTNSDLYGLIGKVIGKDRRDVYHEIAKRYYKERDNPIDPKLVESCFIALLDHRELINELYHRCVSDDTMRRYRLGYYAGRISIPLPNSIGQYIGMKLYLPGAKTAPKMIHMPGPKRNKVLLYPADQLSYDIILLCGGEVKALAALERLNKHNIGAISSTGGEGALDPKNIADLTGKIIYVCMDIDEAGRNAAEKLCRVLRPIAQKVYKVILPLDATQYPKGDINDFLRIGGDIFDLITATEEWRLVLPEDDNPTQPPLVVSLAEAISAENARKPIRLSAIVTAVHESPFSIPAKFNIICDRAQTVCATCPVFINMQPESQIGSIRPDSIAVIEMAGKQLDRQSSILRRAMHIPQQCRAHSFVPIEHHHVEECRVSELLSLTNRATERSMQRAFFVGKSIELNETYDMSGKMYPHPDTQEATLILSDYKPAEDALSNYVPDRVDHLQEAFNPKEWTVDGVREKLREIYSDLEANVTRIYGRQDLHLMVDLAYHSPLFLEYDGVPVNGWVQTLIVGDSSVGKTITAKSLQEHYRLGDWVSCKAITRAGILGGTIEHGKRRFVSWGKLVTNDRRLVIFEELKGADIKVIASTTDARSSGLAEVTMIAKRKAYSRTRVVALSNPRPDGAKLSDYNFGVLSLVELVGSTEDVRRFDACLVVDHRDVPTSAIQQRRPDITHVYNSALCNELVLLAWTIPIVKFEDELHISNIAEQFCKKYVESIPIVDRGSMRYKIARLSAALAMRTCSIENKDTLFVRNCHADYISEFLQSCYDKETFGYMQYSKRIFEQDTLQDAALVQQRIINEMPFPVTFVEQTLLAEEIDATFIQDILGWDRKESQELVSFLIRQRAIRKKGKHYVKTTQFIELLRRIKPIADKPEYLKQGSQF